MINIYEYITTLQCFSAKDNRKLYAKPQKCCSIQPEVCRFFLVFPLSEQSQQNKKALHIRRALLA